MSSLILDDPEDLYLKWLEDLLDEYDDDIDMRCDRYEQLAQRHHAWQMSDSNIDYSFLPFTDMLTQRDLNSHDDHEIFARYLGIDYDTYYEMMIGADDTEEDAAVGISNASNDTK